LICFPDNGLTIALTEAPIRQRASAPVHQFMNRCFAIERSLNVIAR